jgi:hypothetical protein
MLLMLLQLDPLLGFWFCSRAVVVCVAPERFIMCVGSGAAVLRAGKASGMGVRCLFECVHITCDMAQCADHPFADEQSGCVARSSICELCCLV